MPDPISRPLLDWEGCLNARDVGGLPVVGGGRIRCNALLRADSFGHLTSAGVEAVRRCGASRIIDLRYSGEGQPDAPHAAPHPFAEQELYRCIPLFEPGVLGIDPQLLARLQATGTTGEIYCASVDHNGLRIAAAVSAIASAPPGPVVVHCAEGKDRTGIVIALALAVVGVDPQHIAEDYAASAGLLASRFADELATELNPHTRETLQRRHATDPETILMLLDHLESRYAGAASYLRIHGVDDAQLLALRARLVTAE